jgi:hypothetical protein
MAKRINIGEAEGQLNKSFKETVDGMNEDEINELLVKSMQRIKSIKDDMEQDERLKAAKNITKDLSEGYSSARKYEQKRIDYLLSKLEEIQEDSPSSKD